MDWDRYLELLVADWSLLASTARDRIDRLELPGTVTIRTTDGSLGDPAGGPWDGIIVTAAAPSIPTELRSSWRRAVASSSRSGPATIRS